MLSGSHNPGKRHTNKLLLCTLKKPETSACARYKVHGSSERGVIRLADRLRKNSWRSPVCRDTIDGWVQLIPAIYANHVCQRRERYSLDTVLDQARIGSEQRLEISYASLRPPESTCDFWVLKNVRLRYDLEIISGLLRIALQSENGRFFYYESFISQKPLIP